MQCPICEENEMRVVDAREPQGFFSDLSPRDFDGRFEWVPQATRPTVSLDTEDVEFAHTANMRIHAMQHDVLSINDNNGKGGFEFRAVEVYGQHKEGAYGVVSQNDDDPDATSDGPVRATGPTYRVALLSRRRTDVLLVDLPQLPLGVFPDPVSVVGRAAWYSFAFFLRTAAATYLDVDVTELEAGFRSLRRSGVAVGQAFLSDRLENGAGYCRWLGQPDHFMRVVAQADTHAAASLGSQWLADSHARECDTSCNRCLRDFYNQPYHGLLDWRLAIDMARVAVSAKAAVDMDSSWDGLPNPFSTLVEGADAPVPAIMKRIGYGDPQRFGNLRGYVHRSHQRRTVLIECHPLWSEEHPRYAAARQAAAEEYADYDMAMMNPFIAIRRPADYV
jgi:hypothetical protein